MFSSKPKDTVPAPQPMNAAAAPVKRPLRNEHAPSIISADLVVKGTLTSSGDMQIDGRVEGDVRSAGLVIGEKAEIHGEIFAEDVTVRGKVVGRIRARKVQLCSTSHVEGDILHEAFAVEAGAFFEGNIRHSDNPMGDADKKKLVTPIAMQQSIAAAQVSSAPPPSVTPPPTVPPRAMASVATLAPLGNAI